MSSFIPNSHHGGAHNDKGGTTHDVSSSSRLQTSNDSFQDGSLQIDPQFSVHYRIHNRMNLSSQTKAPILTLHGGPGLTSEYLYPLKDVIPYRSIIFYDQLGSGKSIPGPDDINEYSIEKALDHLELLLKKLNLRRFHMYGHSYGGVLAFEYLKRVAERRQSEEDNDGLHTCLSVILSSTPSNIEETILSIDELEQRLLEQDSDLSTLDERFRMEYQCRTTEIPKPLADSYDHVGTVWVGMEVVKDWKANKPSDGSTRMPSCMVMAGEYDFVDESSVTRWKNMFNHSFVRIQILEGCSHHGLMEDGKFYGELVESFFSEYD